jgi:hypothetical protein
LVILFKYLFFEIKLLSVLKVKIHPGSEQWRYFVLWKCRLCRTSSPKASNSWFTYDYDLWYDITFNLYHSNSSKGLTGCIEPEVALVAHLWFQLPSRRSHMNLQLS